MYFFCLVVGPNWSRPIWSRPWSLGSSLFSLSLFPCSSFGLGTTVPGSVSGRVQPQGHVADAGGCAVGARRAADDHRLLVDAPGVPAAARGQRATMGHWYGLPQNGEFINECLKLPKDTSCWFDDGTLAQRCIETVTNDHVEHLDVEHFHASISSFRFWKRSDQWDFTGSSRRFFPPLQTSEIFWKRSQKLSKCCVTGYFHASFQPKTANQLDSSVSESFRSPPPRAWVKNHSLRLPSKWWLTFFSSAGTLGPASIFVFPQGNWLSAFQKVERDPLCFEACH